MFLGQLDILYDPFVTGNGISSATCRSVLRERVYASSLDYFRYSGSVSISLLKSLVLLYSVKLTQLDKPDKGEATADLIGSCHMYIQHRIISE